MTSAEVIEKLRDRIRSCREKLEALEARFVGLGVQELSVKDPAVQDVLRELSALATEYRQEMGMLQ